MNLTRNGRTLDAESMIGFYGPGVRTFDADGDSGITYRRSLISEHVEAFRDAGGRIHTAASGLRWAIVPGEAAAPVVCSEIIQVETEDGVDTGRCGQNADAEGMCDVHAADYARYLSDAAYA